MQRMRKLVGSHRLVRMVQRTQPNANLLPTRLAIHRQLGFVESYLRVYSNSAALKYQPIPVDFQVTPISNRQSLQDTL